MHMALYHNKQIKVREVIKKDSYKLNKVMLKLALN